MRRIAALLFIVLVVGLTPPAIGLEPRGGARYRGTWVGDTAQGNEVKFRVNRQDEVTFVRFTIEIDGPGCGIEVTHTASRLEIPVVNDRFRIETGSLDFEAVIRGRFTSESRARGTVVADTTGQCPGHRRTGWNARPA